MFKLQRLEITGFKSFADYTEIVFTGSGITAVVGPNGCGKSNVSESIAWVLGEQRAKALRGAEMKDVVFQGTRTRKPSGMAEVVLHLVRDEEEFFSRDEEDLTEIDEAIGNLDENAFQNSEFKIQDSEFEIQDSNLPTSDSANSANSVNSANSKNSAKRKPQWRSRSFALDFAPGEAVSVTRRLYLSGESEYQLNGKNCRLRDIQDLFAGTGLSGAHYAIIEQGRIGQILSAKPSDRRSLIEEAAGISKFRTRQRAAETRLESAKLNLRRISDIVGEIDKQANSLRRQAAKTRRFKVLREEFRHLLKKVFTAEGASLTELSGELELKLAAAAEIERRTFAEVSAQNEAFQTATQTARTAEETLSETNRINAENALERDRASRELRYQTEQKQNLENRRAVLQGEFQSTETRWKMLREELARLAAEEKKERETAEKNESELRKIEESHRRKVDELRNIETAVEVERGELTRHTAAVERFAEIARQFENNLERLAERREGLRRESERAAETFAEYHAEADDLAKTLHFEKAKLNELQIEKQTLQTAAIAARTTLKTAEETARNFRNEFSRKQNRLETLRELEEKRAVYAPQIQKLFAAQNKIGVEFAGVLADKLTVAEHAERAVETIFGVYLQSVLVESEDAARKTMAYLQANNVGRIAILVVQSSKFKVRSSSEPQAIANGANTAKVQSKTSNQTSNEENTIADLIGVDGDFAEILHELFPREMAAELVENLSDAATLKSAKSYVDADGNFLSGGKLFIGGKANANEKNTSLLAFKREIRELETATKNLATKLKTAETATEKSRSKLIEQENKIADAQTLIVKIERETVGLEIREKSVLAEIGRAERHRKVVADENKQIEREITEIAGKQTESKINAQKAVSAREISAAALEEITKNLTAARQNSETENALFNETRTLAATSGERRRAAQAALRRVENEEREIASRLSRHDLETAEIENTITSLSDSLAQIGEKIAVAEDEKAREQSESVTAAENLKNSRERADQTSAELAETNNRAAEARNERAAIEIKQTETIVKLRNINEKCAHELNLSLVELVENEIVETDFDLENARIETENLREKLENFGAINMLALEELSESEERLEFLTAQRQDIIDGIAAAEEALSEIKERSRERFTQAFKRINHNFIEYFRELFGGGRGEMNLLEAADVLDAGIEIVAQPPGKRLQNILLLSGGEKAMAAIALVMAIFKYRPAPFCLLDEVDAPLDEANVGRFVDKIAAMSEKTQFIVITHNKRTMEAARALYGVTMQEAGVSKVVSVKFE